MASYYGIEKPGLIRNAFRLGFIKSRTPADLNPPFAEGVHGILKVAFSISQIRAECQKCNDHYGIIKMKTRVTKTPLDGLAVVNIDHFQDDRGFFIESWHSRDFAEAGLSCEFVQDSHS